MDIFEWDENTPVTANNLNEMQNILNQNILDEFNNRSKILWTNLDPTSNFNAQTITLNENLDNYDSYEILALQSTVAARIVSTGRIPVGHGCFLMQGPSRRPSEDTINGTTIYFEDCRSIFPPDYSIINEQMIPMYVIGYKTGLF